ncbi:class I SAM-dependent methyltransferase [Spirosoma sp. KCTC 42546]|uniref:class I SAM-dependent methyltransferase n=1 Tax=Spirosoma sp. KCTC 42546 TaxID=2520506 RepID=UPI001159E75B|nr:class I SAM-dependent methyltransferase [Spirosoma sp. KCTC 42546]QDK79384.1 class I SAM-dependent methyltransferase [Spirosoma sp. KCTC 42546]
MAWYHNFFHGLPQDAWKAAQTEEQTHLDLELLVETLEFGPDDRLLDVFCGYGRHALPLARMGARVTGIDISSDYIAELDAVATAEKLPITAIASDFLTMPENSLGNVASFDAAYCLGNSFSFFPRPDMLVFLTRIATLLKPGGRFLVHTEMVAESVLPDYQARNWQPVEDAAGESILFLVENEYSPLHSRIDSHLTYVKGGEIQTRTAQHYVYTLAELGQLFSEAGFRVIDCYGTVDGDTYELGDDAVWLLVERV